MSGQNEQILPYTANLLGTIKSHLAGLQGYSVMILELLQNADDAKADEIIFDITDSGLHLFNSGEFSYCGKLAESNCLFEEETCDFHRIKEVASGGKLKNKNNIGRFGIGFVSTYQITDNPEIKSTGIKLKLLPEKGQSLIENVPKESGTSFFLPWAFDQNSHARQALHLSAINNNDIQEITATFLSVVRHSLLFLRYIKNVLIKRNGTVLLKCNIDRSSSNELMIEFQPDNHIEIWNVLRANAVIETNHLFETYPQLEQLQRNTDISIAIRTEPESLEKGLLYAYLPTEQRISLPLHINADFFPESDRKSIIFSGKHECAWNEILIEVAAKKIAEDPVSLLNIMRQSAFWMLLNNAYILYNSPDNPTSSFKKFWESLRQSCRATKIVADYKGQLQKPSDVWFLQKTKVKVNEAQQNALHKIGINLISEELAEFSTIYKELGCQELTFSALTEYLSRFFSSYNSEQAVSEQEIKDFYKPLWALVEELLPDNVTTASLYQAQSSAYPKLKDGSLEKLINTKIFVTTSNKPINPNAAYKIKNDLVEKIQHHLPNIPIVNSDVVKCNKLSNVIKGFNLKTLVEKLDSKNFHNDNENLKSLYSMIVSLESDNTSCKKLREEFAIWKTGSKFISAKDALMPGDFTDPTGQANLLDMSVISDDVKKFLSEKLNIKEQNLQEFIKNVLPKFFESSSAIDLHKYKKLINELDKNQQKLINDPSTKETLRNILLLPTQSGSWEKAQEIYRKTDDLVNVLGNNTSLWLNEDKIPSEESVRNFINSLGLLKTPKADDLINRILQIAKDDQPTEKSVKTCAIAFYFLCGLFKGHEVNNEKVSRLKNQKCFPARGDSDNWYTPTELHAPYRAEGFESQAKIIAFSDTSKLEKEILNVIGVKTEPSTEIVINHLFHCASNNKNPHKTTYTILNERSEKEKELIKAKLTHKACIYIDGWGRFAFPYEIYWDTVALGKYAITIPENVQDYRGLFDVIGVKKQPETDDYIHILQKLVVNHHESANKILNDNDLAVYNKCISEINSAFINNEITENKIKSLAEYPIIVNLHKEFVYPTDILLLDSPWHVTNFFENELDQALCDNNHDAWDLFEKMGAKRISQSVSINLDYTDEGKIPEENFRCWWSEYESIILRLTNEYGKDAQNTITNIVKSLSVYSCNLVKIIAVIDLSNNQIKSEPRSVDAFFNKHDNSLLIIKNKTNDWLDIFNNFFYQILPYKAAEEISKLSILLDSFRKKTIEEAHTYLDRAGIAAIRSQETIDGIESEKIEVFVDSESSSDAVKPDSANKEHSIDNQPIKEVECTEISKKSNSQRSMDVSGFTKLIQERKEQEQEKSPEPVIEKSTTPPSSLANHNSQINSSGNTLSDHNWHHWNANNPNRDRGTGSASSARNTATKQRNQQLRSYVLPAQEAGKLKEGSEEKRKHNLAVEAIAREMVCRYERQQGRIPEEMSQTHPGYDIRSIDALTGEERLIEVKGISGDWNNTGVGLSRLQFSNAQDYGETYWLYVVDHISEPKKSTVYPICSPAMKVNTFMFDGGWRSIASIEKSEPILAFIPTAKIRHEQWGDGVICKVNIDGFNERQLMIDFEKYGERTLSFNLNKNKMSILFE